MNRALAVAAVVAATCSGCGGARNDVRTNEAAAATSAVPAGPSSAPATSAPAATAPTAPPPAATAAATTPAPATAAPATSGARPPPAAPTQAPARAPATAPRTDPPPPVPATAAPVDAPFESSVSAIDDATAARMTASWRPGCPVGLEDLRLLRVSHWGFDGRPRVGELVVNARHADAVVGVMAALFGARFPIEQMRLVDEFGADDDRSMAANNTSAFNCRRVAGSDRWSEHAFGGAIDVNPVQNPYVTRSGVSPPAGAAHTSRRASTPGLITGDGPVVAAFAAIGWGWGGSWSAGKDYQHFSASGR